MSSEYIVVCSDGFHISVFAENEENAKLYYSGPGEVLGVYTKPLVRVEETSEDVNGVGEVKIEINGVDYRARIVPFLSDEIITPNFVHIPFYSPWLPSLSDPNRREECEGLFNEIVNDLKENKRARKAFTSQKVGDSINEYPFRVYLEITSKHYKPEEFATCR